MSIVFGRVARIGLAAAFAAVCFLPASSVAAPPAPSGPSFDCAKATAPADLAVCADPGLSARDRTMARLYAAARAKDPLGGGASPQLALQRQWLSARNKACATASPLATCLAGQYDERLFALAVAALFQSPEDALAEIRRQAPKLAPVYEAIYRYATLEDAPARSRAVAALIGPAFEALQQDPGGSMLQDAGGTSAETTAASDKAFATFLDVVAATDLDPTLSASPLPCAAFVRRPGLIDALSSLYGSTMDTRLAQSDCLETLPASPAFDRLGAAIDAAAPECEGTIRFGLERDDEKMRVAIRLHRTDLWRARAADIGARGARERRFRAGQHTLVEAAAADLAAYYGSSFSVASDAARAEAAQAVDVAVTAAFNLCDES